MTIQPEWLARLQEAIIEPELKIVDAHHHLWDRPGAPYLFADYLADVSSGHRVVATVFVECHGMWRARGPESLRPVGETEFASGMAAQSDSGRYGETRMCAAVVGYLDFALGDGAAPVLDAHLAAAGGRFRGVRGRVSSHADPGINQWQTPAGVLAEATTRRAIAAVAERGLSLDVWAYQTQCDEVLDVCRAFPDLTVVIDHCGGPLACEPYTQSRDEMFAAWSRGVRSLAELPNTVMKLSGLGMRFVGFDFHARREPPSSKMLADAWRSYVETCIEAFGPERCLFGSNFPPDKAQCSYAVLWNAFKRLTEGLSPEDRQALFAETAGRVYQIGSKVSDA